MAHRICWSCKTSTHLTEFGGPKVVNLGVGSSKWPYAMCAYTCDSCKVPQVGMARFINHVAWASAEEILEVLDGSRTTWLPQTAVGMQFPDVPENIADAADEAHQCASIGAWRAAVILARSVIEATAKDKGIAGRDLRDKIDGLAKAQLILPQMAEGAHELRFAGNDMAHGDFINSPEQEEGEELLILMGEVLHEVYQSPARSERARARREARRSEIGE